MGLIDRARRARYVYGWRLRYWWLDTESGASSRVLLLCVSVLVIMVQLFRMAVAALVVPPAGQPQEAIVWWVAQLIILVVSAILSYALRPKVEAPKPVTGDAPTVEDGQAAIEVFGEVWVDDEFILAHKVVGTDKIKAGGKK